MAYGGPGSLDEVEPYVLDVRGGKTLPAAALTEIKNRYSSIGGKSPLLEITSAQARSLQRELLRRGLPNRTFVGMRHWHPRITEAVAEMRKEKFKKVVALCLTPQYSALSVGAYFEQYRVALKEHSAQWETIYVNSWHTQPQLVEAYASKLKTALNTFPADARSQVMVVFTAHSLPEKILQLNDPYDIQVKTTSAEVARKLALPCWVFAYQSQGYGNGKWLGPSVEEILQALAKGGTRNVVIAPVGFVSDHVEILYDVDIAFKRLAASLGIRLERPGSLNTTPLFIRSMATTIKEHLEESSVCLGA